MRQMNNTKSPVDKCDPADCSTCGSDCGSRMNLNDKVIEITTDEGEKQKCLIVLKYMMEMKDYIAVMPLLNNPEADIYLYRMINGRTQLENIEDEEEYQRAAQAFGIAMEKAQKESM